MKKWILMLITLVLTVNVVSYGAAKKKVASNSNTPQKVAENFISYSTDFISNLPTLHFLHNPLICFHWQ